MEVVVLFKKGAVPELCGLSSCIRYKNPKVKIHSPSLHHSRGMVDMADVTACQIPPPFFK